MALSGKAARFLLNALIPGIISGSAPGLQIVVPHPQYPDERHTMPVYENHHVGRSVTFAAGEFSNLAYSFYVCG